MIHAMPVINEHDQQNIRLKLMNEQLKMQKKMMDRQLKHQKAKMKQELKLRKMRQNEADENHYQYSSLFRPLSHSVHSVR